MARKKTAPPAQIPNEPPPPKPAARGTTPTQIRLTDDDVRKIDRIREIYGQPSRAGAIRQAINLVFAMLEAGQVPTLVDPRKSAKKSD